MEYFFTCGRGTETFVTKELTNKFPGCKVSQRDGKVFLSAVSACEDEGMEDVESLMLGVRTAERCFVTVLHDRQFAGISSKAVASRLRAAICDIDAGHWQKCLSSWKKLQRAASGPRCTVHCNRSNDRCKPSSDSVLVDDNLKNLPTSRLERPVEDVGSKSAVKRSASDLVTFRVSAKCAGVTSSFNSQTLARYIGPLISHTSGWIPDLRKPSVEVHVHLNNDGLVIGLSACSVPLSVRSYLRHIGLRTTVASVMASLADIQPGMLVVDPMCGEATILLEAAKQFPGAVYIGGDNDMNQCLAAVDNVTFAQETHAVHIINADATSFLLDDASVDAIVSDIPFGSKHGTVDGVRQLLPKLVPSLHRLLKVGGRVVLLVGAGFRQRLIDCVSKLDSASHGDPRLSSGHVSTETNQPSRVPGSNNKETVADIDNITAIASVPIGDHTAAAAVNDKPFSKGDTTVDEGISENLPPVWTTFLEHYVKLGETHAYICGFVKNR